MRTRREIEQIMREAGVMADQVMIGDDVYALPSKEWLSGRFAEALRTFFNGLELNSWEAEKNDCDDFARGAAWFAAMLHNRSAAKAGLKRSGLAIGEIWYRQADGVNHAINCAIIPEPGKDRVVFFEPQNVLRNADPIVELSEEERMICLGYRY